MSGDCTRSSTGAITCTKSNGTALGTGAFATIANYAPLASPTFTGTVSGITATMVGLGNVTNNAQTQAAIVPNTAPSAGQDLVGNAGGTAYAPVTMSGDCTRSSTGAITCTKSNGTALGSAAFTASSAYDASGAAAARAATGSCTNQVATANTTSGPTCTTVTSSYVDTSIAKTGADINTSNQVTVTHLAAALPANQGGTGSTLNTWGCLDGFNHYGCVVWRATTLTGQTGNAGISNFNPPQAGEYRVTTMACITTVGTAGTLTATVWMGLSTAYGYSPFGAAMSLTSPLGSCSVTRADGRVPVSGSSYSFGPGGAVTGNVGGQFSLDAYAEYMGP
jgi:hypothetical protein